VSSSTLADGRDVAGEIEDVGGPSVAVHPRDAAAKECAVEDALARALDKAQEGPALSNQDRTALAEAAADPNWVRMSRGDAFERLVCNDDE